MSVEYTIDIQLTELGFPDILQSEEASERQSTRCSPTPADSFSSNVKSLSAAHKQRHQINQYEKETGVARHTSNTAAESPPSTQPPGVELNPAKPLRAGEGVDGSRDAVDCKEEAVAMRVTGGELGTSQQDGDIDSDGSEVGYVYENLFEDCQEDGDEEDEEGEDEEEDDNEDDGDVEEEDEDEEEEGVPNSVLNQSCNHRCSICHIQLSSKLQFKDHMNLHTGARPYFCAECGKRFCQVHSYRAHLRTHAKGKPGHHQCRICLKDFRTEEELKFHLSITHFEKQFFECDLCKRLFPSRRECEKHVQEHKRTYRFACYLCHRRFAYRKSFMQHRKTKCGTSFKCTDCSSTFPRKNALLKHSFSHLGLAPYTCIRCQHHFRLARLYNQHVCQPGRIHCVACLREFARQEDFEQHKKDTGCWGNQESNTKSDEIRCLECGQRFDSSEELKKHAGAHQRVLKCAECGKGFRSALLLMSHMGGHAGKSPCLCQTCGLGFPYQQNYDSHLKTCGQPPPPASALKKQHTSKSSLPQAKQADAESKTSKPSPFKKQCTSKSSSPPAEKLTAKSKSPKAESTVTTPAAVPKKTSDEGAPKLQESQALQKVASAPRNVANGASSSSPPPEGLWKLTLDKQPPPGVNLVVFLPVCPLQSTELPLASGIPQTLALPAMQALSQTTLSGVPASGHFGVNAAFGMPLSTPLDFVPSNNNDYPDTPLDLSQKSTLQCLPSVKEEPEEIKLSEGAQCKVEPMEVSSPNLKTKSPSPVMQIKEEPQNSGSYESETLEDWRPVKKIKKETDL
ncbi:unnamed protein product [Ophioblennius macclurei]